MTRDPHHFDRLDYWHLTKLANLHDDNHFTSTGTRQRTHILRHSLPTKRHPQP